MITRLPNRRSIVCLWKSIFLVRIAHSVLFLFLPVFTKAFRLFFTHTHFFFSSFAFAMEVLPPFYKFNWVCGLFIRNLREQNWKSFRLELSVKFSGKIMIEWNGWCDFGETVSFGFHGEYAEKCRRRPCTNFDHLPRLCEKFFFFSLHCMRRMLDLRIYYMNAYIYIRNRNPARRMHAHTNTIYVSQNGV